MPIPTHPFRLSRLGAALCLFLILPCPALALELTLPLLCNYGTDCSIQNYVDTDPTPDWRDYDCGFLTYDGHKGTDFRIPWKNYEAGVDVVAAAPGVVARIRDEMEDHDGVGSLDRVKGKEAGNAIIIQHGQGYETWYAHLKRGSVLVRPGDKVQRGQVIGQVGMSGLTMFSHLHFSVRHLGTVVCPFKGTRAIQQDDCGDKTRSLWAPQELAAMQYTPTGLLQAGFFDHQPTLPHVVRREAPSTIAADAPIFLFAATAYGVQPNDSLHVRIFAPDGTLFASGERTVAKHQAQRLLFTGRKLKNGNRWTKGTYRGEYEIQRAGKTALRATRTVTVR